MTLYRNLSLVRRPRRFVVYDEPFWRADGFSGQSAEARLRRRGDSRCVTGVRFPRRHCVVHISGRWQNTSTRSTRLSDGVRCSMRSRPGSGRGLRCPPNSSRRPGNGGVDSRLFDGPSPPRDPHALRTPSPRAVQARALGRNGTSTTSARCQLDGAVRSGERAAAEILQLA